ncbi:MAG: LptF/LptG family permease, partial [Planctomycetota bacterium]
AFLAALVALTLLVTVGMGVKEGLSRGLPPIVILKTMPWMVPEMLGITIPVGMLFAVTSVFHRMAGANEIVALKSLGISPMAVLRPVLLTAATLSLLTVSIYEIAATWCRPTVQQLVFNSLEEIAYGMLRANRSFTSPVFSATVRKVVGHTLIGPTITIHGDDSRPTVTLRAEQAEFETDLVDGTLLIACFNGELEVEGQAQYTFPDELRRRVPLQRFEPPVHRDWLGSAEIPRHVAEFERQLDEATLRLEATGDSQAADTVKFLSHQIARLRTEPYRRWANGFSCLCFALVGAPVAMTFRYGDALASFFVCFLPILSVYYPLLMVSEDLSTSGTLPPIAFWIANAAIALPGLWLLSRAVRN